MTTARAHSAMALAALTLALSACAAASSEQPPPAWAGDALTAGAREHADAPFALTAPDGSPLPAACVSWARRLCQELGAQSEGCAQAEAALPILPASACQAALGEVDATVARAKRARSTCDTLVDKLCAELGKEAEACALVRERTAEIPAGRCRELLDQYPAVLAELRRIAQRNAPITAAVLGKQLAGDSPSFGPRDARVTLIEYSDFQCPYCQEAAKTVAEIRRRYGSVVRFVFRQYPLPKHRHARAAAEAALAAHAQGKFWEYHDLLFANQDRLAREDLEAYAKQAGLDLGKFRRALDEGSARAAVAADIGLGDELGVEGTPSMIVGTERVPDPRDFAEISRMIEAQLKAAGVAIPPAP